MEPFLIVVVGLILALAIGFVVRRAGGPGDPAQPTPPRPEHSATGREDGKPDIPPYPTGERPAGPGAESMNAEQSGDAMPGDPVDGGEAAPDATPPSEAGRKRLDENG